MPFHHPGRPDDLPPPHLLWARAATMAALAALGCRTPLALDGRILFYDDGGGNTWRLTWVEGNRAVLVGYDHECSDTLELLPDSLDLLRGAPDWLPWEWVGGLEAAEQAAFVYWWDGAWGRTPYPDDLEDDGLAILLKDLASTDEAVNALTRHLRGGRSSEATPGAVRAAVRRVLLGAESGAVDRADVTAVRGLVAPHAYGVDAAMDIARRTGLMPGTERPALPAGHARPERPAPAAIGDVAWGLLIGDAMRQAGEAERPAPAPSPELDRVVDWIRAEALDPGASTTVTYSPLAGWWITKESGERITGFELHPLLRALRDAEAHPEHGRWFFVRMVVTERTAEVDRAYDHWPRWHPPRDPSGGRVWPGTVVEEVRGRAPRWRPEWVHLATEETRWSPPALTVEPGGSPSVPLRPLSPDEQREILVEVGLELVEQALEDWRELRLSYRTLLGYEGVEYRAVDPSGEVTPLRKPQGVHRALSRLREGMYTRGEGTWFGLEYVVTRPGRYRVDYSYDDEPAFGLDPGDVHYAVDALHFPRDAEHTPDWLRRRIGGGAG
ncbi:hypothetical protein [Nocardiopsis sp. FIRDI 009]|uniref:hypothetical protein n=1 Tax=Nocardiopsis sp. FIRDI 009 TaxID=714197 RepID=UPI000E237651|nr:hypothetical protein [Nocardiopsis sp. FIRDI 009]